MTKYYLDSDGSDSNDGLSAEFPFGTPGKARSEASSDGDEILLMCDRGDKCGMLDKLRPFFPPQPNFEYPTVINNSGVWEPKEDDYLRPSW